MEATNGTESSYNVSSSQQQQASGRAIFWALATIVINAMLQPSFIGHLWRGDLFEDSLWPHRSSPFICLVDAVADIRLIREKNRKPDVYHVSNHDYYAKPTTVMMRLAIFVLGVVPQAIKLFCMRGVLVTQVIAAAFLLATLASMARTLHIQSPYEDSQIFLDQETTHGSRSPRHPRGSWSLLSKLCGVVPHIAAAFYVWSCIGRDAEIVVSEDGQRVFDWYTAISLSALNLYVLLHFIVTIIRGKPWMPRMTVWVVLLFAMPHAIVHGMLSTDDADARSEAFTFNVMCVAVLICYGLAWALEVCARALLRWLRKEGASATSQSHLPTTSRINTTAESSATGSTTLESVQMGSGAPTASRPQPYTDSTASDTAASSSRVRNTDSGENPPEQSAVRAVDALTASSITPSAAFSFPNGRRLDKMGSQMAVLDSPVTRRDINTATNSTRSSSTLSTNDADASLHWAERAIILVLTPPVRLALTMIDYARIGSPDESSADQQLQQQDATEQGEAASSSAPPAPSPGAQPMEPLNSPMMELFILADKLCRTLVKILLLMPWRFLKAFWIPFQCFMKSLDATMECHAKDRLWVAFGVFNLATAMVYFLVVFEGEGTYSPSWASILGK